MNNFYHTVIFLTQVHRLQTNSLKNQHNNNLEGGLDVPPDLDACGDQLQSIEKTLGGHKNQ